MKRIYNFLPLLAAGLLMASCYNNDEEGFANKAFIDASEMTAETIIKGDVGVITKTLNITTSRPVETQITATATTDVSLVEKYNKAYYANAVALPDSCYEMAENKMVINAGSVKSSEAMLNFSKLGSLDRALVYVLPVKINTNGLEILTSADTYYYVFRAGALINVVADIENNYLEIYPWKTADRVRNIQKITMEALVYPREFNQLISTVMGIEGAFLMRIGDAGIPDNQLQIATSIGNFTNSSMQLTPGTWSHVALTYDRTKGEMFIYLNGKQVGEFKTTVPISIYGNGGDRNFLIGKSYEDGRDLNGYISEARVWDIIRSQEEIAAHIYNVAPTTEGLIAYWKFDDMTSSLVKDYSGNGNDIKAMKGNLTWKNVSLPAAK